MTLRMPVIDFEEIQGAEIWFMEEGVLRKLQLNEWKAYFPGCGDPIVMTRARRGNTEQVWQKAFPSIHRDTAIRHGLWPAIFRTPDKAGDQIPPLNLAIDRLAPTLALRLFAIEYRNSCERWPDAFVAFIWA